MLRAAASKPAPLKHPLLLEDCPQFLFVFCHPQHQTQPMQQVSSSLSNTCRWLMGADGADDELEAQVAAASYETVVRYQAP